MKPLSVPSLSFRLRLVLACLCLTTLGGCSKVLPPAWSAWMKDWPDVKAEKEREENARAATLAKQQKEAENAWTRPDTAFTRAKPYPVPPEPLLEEPETPGPLAEEDMQAATPMQDDQDVGGSVRKMVPALSRLIEGKNDRPEQSAGSPPVSGAPAALGAPRVQDVRFGEHPGRSRIVLDLSGPAPYQYAFDNASGTLSVTLKGAGWTAGPQGTVPRSPLLEGWSAQNGGSGDSVMTVRLRGPAKVVHEELIGPSEGRGHRLVLDIARQ